MLNLDCCDFVLFKHAFSMKDQPLGIQNDHMLKQRKGRRRKNNKLLGAPGHVIYTGRVIICSTYLRQTPYMCSTCLQQTPVLTCRCYPDDPKKPRAAPIDDVGVLLGKPTWITKRASGLPKTRCWRLNRSGKKGIYIHTYIYIYIMKY